MAVKYQYQSLGIDRKILFTKFYKSRQLDADYFYLKTSSILPKTLAICRKLGLKKIYDTNEVIRYQRVEIYMELYI